MAPVPDPGDGEQITSSELSSGEGPAVLEITDSDSQDSDSVDDQSGYMQLPQDPSCLESSEDESGSIQEKLTPQCNAQTASAQINLSENETIIIKHAMSKISLPSIPVWATVVPEEQWKTTLLNGVRTKKELEPKDAAMSTPLTSADIVSSNVNNDDTRQFHADFDSFFNNHSNS